MSVERRRRRANRAKHPSAPGPVRGPSSVSPQRPRSGSPASLAKSAFSGRALWVSLALIVVTMVVYAPVWDHNFVSMDDPLMVSDNPHVSGGLKWTAVRWALTAAYFGDWHPVTWLSHMLDVQLYGMNAGGHHLTNLLLHVANTLLLFGLLRRMTGALGRSAFVAGLFAVHPLHVESVAWVAARTDVLSTLFWMLTLWGYVGYVRQPRRGRYLVVILLFASGLMAKPMLVTLPFVLLLLDFWPLGRVQLGVGHPSSFWEWASARHRWSAVLGLVREKLPLLGLSATASVATFVVRQQGEGITGLDALPPDLRLANALLSYVTYIGKMLWPTGLTAFYPYPRAIPTAWVLGSVLFLMGVSGAVIWVARRHPYLLVGWFWYLGTLVPVIGLVQVGGQASADRYTYVPLIGVFLMLAWGIPDLLARWPDRSIALPVTAGVLLLACAITARGQVQYWRDDAALWGHALEVTTENYFAHTGLGDALASQGRVAEAIAHYSEAVRIRPDYTNAHNKLGVALADQGRIGEAIIHYTEALRIEPDFPAAHVNLGNALATQGKASEAIAQYTTALRIQPDNVAAHNNLGFVLASQGRGAEAIAHYTEALQIKSDYALAHNNLGFALASQGRVDEAIREFRETLRLNPDQPKARRMLDDLTRQSKRSGLGAQ